MPGLRAALAVTRTMMRDCDINRARVKHRLREKASGRDREHFRAIAVDAVARPEVVRRYNGINIASPRGFSASAESSIDFTAIKRTVWALFYWLILF